MQVGASSGPFSGWIDAHPFRRANNADHLPFGQDVPASHTGPLGYMLYAVDGFPCHLHFFLSSQEERFTLPLRFNVFRAAFVLLPPDHLTEVLIELKFNTFLLTLLALLFIRGVFFEGAGVLEDLGLHLE